MPINADAAAAWDAYAQAYQARVQLPTDVVHYGPDIPTETELRLCGDVKGKRVLDLGCGAAQAALSLARQGAVAIGVDFSAEQLAVARRLADRESLKVELHQSDLAELAFIRADTIDLALSVAAFDYVEDLGRVFRQVHRVLKSGAALVFSMTHPAWRMTEDRSPTPEAAHDAALAAARDAIEPASARELAIRSSYFDASPIARVHDGVTLVEHPRTTAELFGQLARANFRLDALLEPEPAPSGPRSAEWSDAFRSVPRTLVVRARKEGI